MKCLIPILVMLTVTGCCRLTEPIGWPGPGSAETGSALYKFRLERSGETRLSGLLALNFHTAGIWGGLLDATGVPLVKIVVQPDGARVVEFCAKTVCDTRLPEVLGNLVEYLYFTPARAACPWYAVSCICEETEKGRRAVKWKRFGPFHSWEVQQLTPPGKKESIEVRMYFSSVRVYLQRIEEQGGTHQDERDTIHRTETP